MLFLIANIHSKFYDTTILGNKLYFLAEEKVYKYT